MNLREVDHKIRQEQEFKYSTMFGDVSDMTLKMDSRYHIQKDQIPLDVLVKYAMKHWQEDEVVYEGKFRDGVYYLHINVTQDFIQRMSPSEFLKEKLGKDTVQGKALYHILQEYGDYCVEVYKRLNDGTSER